MTNLQKELKELKEQPNLMVMFEVPVIDKRTNEEDFIVCDDLTIRDGLLKAYRIGITKEEEESQYIASSAIEIDGDFSLDHHLQELYSQIIDDILNSDFFTL